MRLPAATPRRLANAAIAVVLVGLAVSATAPARPSVDDLQLGIVATTANSSNVVTSLAFVLDFAVSTDGGPQTITLRFTLPAGLRFANPPNSAEGCQAGPPVVCRVPPSTNEAGTMEFRKRWGVVAAASGIYEVTASVEGDRPDPDPTNNTRTYRFEVRTDSGGGGSEGGGGGGTAVSAGAVKLSPGRPKAGSAVVASVRVTRGGSPLRPTGVVCAAALGGAKTKGTGRAASGVASCLFKTPKTARGKTLAGSIAFRAGGRVFTRRFATRLG